MDKTGGPRWYLGAINDGLFIIDAPPRPNCESPWHDRPNGPQVVLNVCSLTQERAQSIVDAHNAAMLAARGGEVGNG